MSLYTLRRWIFRAAVVAAVAVAPFGAYGQAPQPGQPATVQAGSWDAAASPAHLVVAPAAAPSAVFDWSQLIMAMGTGLISLVVTAAAALFNKRDTDEKDRQAFLVGAQNAGAFAANTLDGYLKGHPIQSASLPPLLVQALNYLKTTMPDRMKRMKMTNEKALHVIIGQLPGISGAVDDATIHSVAAAVDNAPTTGPKTVSQLAVTLAPEVEAAIGAMVAAKFAAATKPADHPGQPQGSGA